MRLLEYDGDHMRHHILETPTGDFAIMIGATGELSTGWVAAGLRRRLAESRLDRTLLASVSERLKRYFEGDDVDFSDIETPGGAPFQYRCWRTCRRIPRGQTWSYGRLAARAGGSPNAARAAGQAMRHNRLPIIIPCHRVIGSNGSLHGFGGSCDANGQALTVKRALLELEGAIEPAGVR